MMQDVYKAPEAELIGPQNMTDTSEFFVVSIRKLWIMNLLTIGSYGLVWHYQHWKQFRDSISDRDIWPVPRAIFTIFFVHALFGLIQDSSQQKGADRIVDHINNDPAQLFLVIGNPGKVLWKMS